MNAVSKSKIKKKTGGKMRVLSNFLEFASKSESKMFVLMLSASVILFTFFYKIKSPYINDPKVEIRQYTPEVLSKLSSQIKEIKSGLHVKNFTEFDILRRRFRTNLILWFMFNPTEIQQERVDQFTIDNAPILKKIKKKTKVVKDKIIVFYEITADLPSVFNFETFPFDKHRIPVIVSNEKMLPSEFTINSSSTLFVVPEDLQVSDWDISAGNVTHGFRIVQLGIDSDQIIASQKIAYPVTVFNLNISRTGFKVFLMIFFPILLLLFLSLLSLGIDIHDYRTYNFISLTTLITLLLYRFVLENMSPNVNYFTISDKIYLLSVLIALLAFLINILSARYIHKYPFSGKINTLKLTRATLLNLFAISVTAYIVYLLI